MHIMSESTYPLSGEARVVRRDVTFIFHGWGHIEIEDGHTMFAAPSEEDETLVHATFVFRGDRPYAVLFGGCRATFRNDPTPSHHEPLRRLRRPGRGTAWRRCRCRGQISPRVLSRWEPDLRAGVVLKVCGKDTCDARPQHATIDMVHSDRMGVHRFGKEGNRTTKLSRAFNKYDYGVPGLLRPETVRLGTI
jgi:hypothetical protein